MAFFVPLAYPTATRNVSDSFADHVARGSVNPGTDYTASYGSEVVSVADGYVSDIVVTNYGSGGRMIYVDHDDGSGVDYLHLSRIDVVKGQRVLRKQHLGLSGASGFRDDWYYGPHLHISIRNRHGSHAMNAGNYDFDASIRAQWATAGWASDGGAVPIDNTPTPIIPKEDPDMWVVGAKNGIGIAGAVFTIGPEYIRHEPYAPGMPGDQSGDPGQPYGVGFTARVVADNDKIIWAEQAQFNALLASFDIPADKVAGVLAGGGGKAWSRQTQILAALKIIPGEFVTNAY